MAGARRAAAAAGRLLALLLAPAGARERQPVHIFSYADQLHTNLCALASSVEAIGARLNVLGLEDASSAGAIPITALPGMFTSLAVHSRQPRNPKWRSSAAVPCADASQCNVAKNIFKIRKFFSLWPHLKDFEDDEVLLFLDGFDTVLEAPSLEHLRASFERLQERLQTVVRSPAGGPVIFNGEGNCWPFPHGGPVAGDYRPNYEYRISNHSLVKGEEVCEHWSRASRVAFADGGLGDGGPEGPIHLPFPNSGVFIGRVQSIRRLFELSSKILHRYADFDDQALVYVTALSAAAEEPRWAPLWVDVHGELLASLHGLDLHLLSRRLKAPLICDYHGRIYYGYFASAVETRNRKPSRWNADMEVPPPPVVLHFNGDKKIWFDSRCKSSAYAQAYEAGTPPGTCRVISYTLQREFRWVADKEDDFSVYLEERRVHVPRPRVTLTMMQVLAAGSLSRGILDVAKMLLAQAQGPQLVAAMQVPAASDDPRPCAGVGRPWHYSSPSEGDFTRQWYDGKLVQHGEAGGLSLDGLFLRRNETRCAETGGHAGGPSGPYCRLYWALRSSWECLKNSVGGSPGLFWAEFQGIKDFLEMSSRANASRHAHECTRGPEPPEVAEHADGGGPCPGQAVMDFLEALPHWEVTHFRFAHRHDMSVVLALKLPRF